MSGKFKKGQKVMRSAGTREYHGIHPGDVCVVDNCTGSHLWLEGHSDYAFDATRFEPYDAAAQSWDYAEATRLHGAAVKAVEEYNAYIERKPDVFFTHIFL